VRPERAFSSQLVVVKLWAGSATNAPVPWTVSSPAYELQRFYCDYCFAKTRWAYTALFSPEVTLIWLPNSKTVKVTPI